MRALIIFMVATLAGAVVAPGAAAAAGAWKRHTATFCSPGSDFAHLFSGGSFVAQATGALKCPYMDDAQLPHEDAAVIYLNVSDNTTAGFLTAAACTQNFAGTGASCGASVTTSQPGTGDQTLSLPVTEWVGSWANNYPYLSIYMNSGTRVHGYVVMN